MMLKKLILCIAGLASLGSVGMAYAVLPTAATDAVTTIQTDALAMIDAVWPYVAAITLAFVVFRIFRRSVNAGG